jgi:hypothetical protein
MADIPFQDEIWGAYNGDPSAQYDINDPRLPMLNPIIQEGTFHNQGNMNNLVNFDNADSFPGCVNTGTFGANDYTEEWRRGNLLIARRVTDFATLTEITELFFSDGNRAHRRIVKTSFPSGQIKIEVTE